LQEIGINSALLTALNFMRLDENDEPNLNYIEKNLEVELNKYPNINLFITQGYICRNAFGEIDNLKRGGSDYTASIIGAAIKANEVQIWTDIDGMHNNDPRIVKKTVPIEQMSFDEAAELAYFGKMKTPKRKRDSLCAKLPVVDQLSNTLAGQQIEHSHRIFRAHGHQGLFGVLCVNRQRLDMRILSQHAPHALLRKVRHVQQQQFALAPPAHDQRQTGNQRCTSNALKTELRKNCQRDKTHIIGDDSFAPLAFFPIALQARPKLEPLGPRRLLAFKCHAGVTGRLLLEFLQIQDAPERVKLVSAGSAPALANALQIC